MKPKKLPTINLTGVLIGNDKTGYTAFFKEIPFVTAEGSTVTEAENNLIETVMFTFETMSEIAEEEKVIPDTNDYRQFSKTLTFA